MIGRVAYMIGSGGNMIGHEVYMIGLQGDKIGCEGIESIGDVGFR
jgi:hypothetical protein